MSDNLFLFRNGEYSPQEMLDRIPSGEYTPERSEFEKLLRELGSDPDEVSNLAKGDFISRLHREMKEEDYLPKIESVFEDVGWKGDQMNFQFYDLPDTISSDRLSIFSDWVGRRLGDKWGGLLSNDLYLKDYQENTNMSSVDLCFKYMDVKTDIEGDEDLPIELLDPDDHSVVDTIEGNYTVRAPAEQIIETRVYTENGLTAVSNSSVNDGLQSDIISLLLKVGCNQEVDS